MSEAEFISAIIREADCLLHLDMNNIYVNSQNFGFDPLAFMTALPLERTCTIRPRKPQPTHLLVYRDAADTVQFVASNPVTARLLTLLASESLTGRSACLRIAEELQHPAPEVLVSHGHAMLESLRQQSVVLGTQV